MGGRRDEEAFVGMEIVAMPVTTLPAAVGEARKYIKFYGKEKESGLFVVVV